MRVEDLFPLCTIEDCPLYLQHKHILPHQQEFLNSIAKYIYWQGGFGSGKTLPAVAKCLLLMQAVPGNRGLIGRRSYPKLHDSTQRIFMEILSRSNFNYEGRENRDGWFHHILLENGSEVFFRPTANLGQFLGPEYGFFLVDEAQEEPRKTFTDLMGRLRLPLARDYLWGCLLSNPPGENSWLCKDFGKEPRVFGKTAEGITTLWEFKRSSTRLNPHLPKAYVSDLVSTLGEEEAMRVIEGMYGFEMKGVPVYRPPFSHGLHVGQPPVTPHLALIRAWDFGRRHPAVTFHQIWTCTRGRPHWFIVGEVVHLQGVDSSTLFKETIEYTTATFPQHSKAMILDCGDRSGINEKAQGHGEIAILRKPPYNLHFKYRYFEVLEGIDFISNRLTDGKCSCGVPYVYVHNRCKGVSDGFAGGYHYPREQPEKAPKDKPVKDGYYDDIMDSVRYAAENYIRPALRDQSYIQTMLYEHNTEMDRGAA